MAKRRDKRVAPGAMHDRTAKSARPWNDPDVINANDYHRRRFGSYKKVHEFENTVEDKGILSSSDRLTCRPCGKFKKSCGCDA